MKRQKRASWYHGMLCGISIEINCPPSPFFCMLLMSIKRGCLYNAIAQNSLYCSSSLWKKKTLLPFHKVEKIIFQKSCQSFKYNPDCPAWLPRKRDQLLFEQVFSPPQRRHECAKLLCLVSGIIQGSWFNLFVLLIILSERLRASLRRTHSEILAEYLWVHKLVE